MHYIMPSSAQPKNIIYRLIFKTNDLHFLLIYFCILGQNNQSGKSILKSDYTEENDVEKNLKLAVKILLKVNIR